MKKILATAGLSIAILSVGCTATKTQAYTPAEKKVAITKAEATQKIANYLMGSNHVSKIIVCENDKYYIGEAILEGYENLGMTGDEVRKVYVKKSDGTILPTMSEHSDYCYMLKK